MGAAPNAIKAYPITRAMSRIRRDDVSSQMEADTICEMPKGNVLRRCLGDDIVSSPFGFENVHFDFDGNAFQGGITAVIQIPAHAAMPCQYAVAARD